MSGEAAVPVYDQALHFNRIGSFFISKWRETVKPRATKREASQIATDEDSPTELDVIKSSGGFAVVGPDKLSLSYRAVSLHSYDVGAVQANRPTPSKCFMYYFEITVENAGAKGKIAIGFSTSAFNLRRQPGWEPKSYGYHGDDGLLYHGCGKGETFGPTFTTGDTVGGGIIYGDRQIFFTKNGQLVGTVSKNATYGPMYPTVAVHSQNERVTVNFGKSPFVFDHKPSVVSTRGSILPWKTFAYESEQRAKQQMTIDSVIIPHDASYDLVRSYLQHHGYQETLRLFDMARETAFPPVSIENCVDEEDCEYALNQRMTLRKLIQHGQIDDAFMKLKEWYPQILLNDNSICFLLQCQQFIELVRIGKLEEAVQLGRREFEKYKELPGFNDLSKDCATLLAYEEPIDSSIRYLLSKSQRELVADAVNSAVLSMNPQLKDSSYTLSRLETIVRQITACFSEKQQGESFQLSRFLQSSLSTRRV